MERDKKMILGKGIVAFVMSMLIVCLVGNLFLIENCAAATTLYVGGSGPGNYSKIQDAIDNARDGDTVIVSSGTYNENVYIDKSIDVIGYYMTARPRVNGQGAFKSTIEIMADWVNFSGFYIDNAVGKVNNFHGIAVGFRQGETEDHYNVTISDCFIAQASWGVMLRGGYCTVEDNEMATCITAGIHAQGTHHILNNNFIHHCSIGIECQYASYITITNNRVTSNTNDGVKIWSDVNNVSVYNNNFTSNYGYGVYIGNGCKNNWVYHNYFVNNGVGKQAYDSVSSSTNHWNLTYPQPGNYWSDYNNYDTDGDGIGDAAYQIPPAGNNNKDYYPFGLFLESNPSGGGNQVPTAYITYITPNPATQGQPISFSGSGSDDGFIASYNWRSNVTGQLSTQASFTTSNLPAGAHTISFKVQDNEGVWSIDKTVNIAINPAVNHAPIAYIDEITPTPAKQREAVLFRGHGTDEDGSIIAYKWLSSKDGVISTASSFSKTNLSLGTHTIYFQVKDNTEWSPQAIRTLVVEKNSSSNPDNQAPIADVGGPYQGNINGAIMFDGSGSHDEEGAIVGYWNFGDNSSGTGLSPTHLYTAPGTYIVTLTVTDEDGDSTTASTSVAITQSTLQGSNPEGFSAFDLEIPFPIIIIVVFLSVLGVIIGFILRMKRG